MKEENQRMEKKKSGDVEEIRKKNILENEISMALPNVRNRF